MQLGADENVWLKVNVPIAAEAAPPAGKAVVMVPVPVMN